MSKKQTPEEMMGELTHEQLVEQLSNSLQVNENMKANQQGLIDESKQLRNQIDSLSAGKSIYGKLLAVKRDLGYVAKDQKNSGQGWMFRGIDQFLNAIKPLLDTHGVGISTKVVQNAEEYKLNEKTGKYAKNTRLIMEYIFFAEDGSTVSCQMPAEGVDPGDKGTNKALSAALKYCLIQTFAVPTKDTAEADSENPTNDSGKVSGKATATKTVTPTGEKAAAAPAKKSFRRKSVAKTPEASSDIDL
jgi:hypothetical protein